ncbi:probable ATP-dependent RNA helicase CG8611 isoform X2 [Anopheles stephensi]|uniref:probable ATP-dependent RNA helicase CG8611 isoform X2 n=1 Tax=Anopheles stephensi TaxID=30069 RepID=UPI0016588A5B|nr:probable ATP-dependent RNA helicase CG8611 isoform X2 [Anopheles stephensi]
MDLILSSFISDESEQVIPCRAEQSITNYKNAEISMNFSKVQAANVIVARKRGRTARAGESGKAVLFIEPSEMDFIKYLSNKHIRIKEQSATGVIRNFGRFINSDTKCNSELKEYRAVEFQHRYEQLINEENELFDGAKKAFTSWVRYYSNFPKELRHIFYIKAVHMGHYAKSLGLRDAPKHLLQGYTDQKHGGKGNPVFKRKEQHNSKQLNLLQDKKKLSGRNKDDLRSLKHGRSFERSIGIGSRNFVDSIKRSRMLNTSEFESGISPARKKLKAFKN